jgi:hypothetical protein
VESSPVTGAYGSGSEGEDIPRRRRREPSESESDSISLRPSMVTNLPEVAKSEIRGVARSECTRGTIRDGWEGRALKDRPRYLGDPVLCLDPGSAARAGALWLRVAACGERGESENAGASQSEPAGIRQRRWGIHNPPGGGSRKSDQPIVAKKRGNARGARGLCFSRVFTKGGRPD